MNMFEDTNLFLHFDPMEEKDFQNMEMKKSGHTAAEQGACAKGSRIKVW